MDSTTVKGSQSHCHIDTKQLRLAHVEDDEVLTADFLPMFTVLENVALNNRTCGLDSDLP